ncbi:UNVERIFIED_CONTAM: hypothetical protein Slati_4174900 [Sesamum latifolium]|uniref:FAD/NAD(P)-binding domain-containing protein n=1 Tax=Sesamum latifolium TaxID=2727402 RepID=A0AAW2T9R2_9LAMI
MDGFSGEKKRVVVVGGVAGSLVAKNLQDHADVFLIDSKEFFELPWAGLRSKVEPSFAKRIVINHLEYLSKARVIASPATNITEDEVLTAQGRLIAYDYLVVATGHTSPGGYTKDERLNYYQTDQSRKVNFDRWRGPTGVELAGEIVVDFPDKKVTLVHKGPRLLEFIGEKAGKKALDWLTSKKVEVILGQSVNLESESDGTYETSGGETIVADCHFLCAGNPIGSSWLKETILKDCLDDRGRLMVDATLRVKGHSNIFAIGDITDVPELKQGYLAQAHAMLTAKNLKKLISGQNSRKLSTYKPASDVAIVSLGRREGIAQFMCLTVGGRLPGIMKSKDLFVGKTRNSLGLKSNVA